MRRLLFFLLLLFVFKIIHAQTKRARDWGIQIGVLPTGKQNAITDVPGVKVGHTTLIKGDSIRTGVTAILPHSGNIFQQKSSGSNLHWQRLWKVEWHIASAGIGQY